MGEIFCVKKPLFPFGSHLSASLSSRPARRKSVGPHCTEEKVFVCNFPLNMEHSACRSRQCLVQLRRTWAQWHPSWLCWQRGSLGCSRQQGRTGCGPAMRSRQQQQQARRPTGLSRYLALHRAPSGFLNLNAFGSRPVSALCPT